MNGRKRLTIKSTNLRIRHFTHLRLWCILSHACSCELSIVIVAWEECVHRIIIKEST